MYNFFVSVCEIFPLSSAKVPVTLSSRIQFDFSSSETKTTLSTFKSDRGGDRQQTFYFLRTTETLNNQFVLFSFKPSLFAVVESQSHTVVPPIKTDRATVPSA